MGGLVGYEHEHVARDANNLMWDAWYAATSVADGINRPHTPWHVFEAWRNMLSPYFFAMEEAIAY